MVTSAFSVHLTANSIIKIWNKRNIYSQFQKIQWVGRFQKVSLYILYYILNLHFLYSLNREYVMAVKTDGKPGIFKLHSSKL